MDPLVWAVILLVFGLLLVGIEVFAPSGGLLGVLSFSAIAAGIGLAFYYRGLYACFALRQLIIQAYLPCRCV